jgi:hypothetical protein
MPLLNAQYCPETGNSLRLTFDTPVVGVNPAQYVIDSVIAHALSNATQSGGTPYEWFMTIDPPLYQGEVATLSYSGADTVDTGEIPEALATFSGAPIDNQSTVPIPDTTPPAAPTGLTATAGNAEVALIWDANGEGDLAGYFVQRADAIDGPYLLLMFVQDGTTYTDTDVTNGQTYYYLLNAIDLSNNQSAPSSPVSATPAAPPDRPPAVPQSRLSIGLGIGL